MDGWECIQDIREIVEQCFCGNYETVAGDMPAVIEKISATCSLIEDLGPDPDDLRLMQFLLYNIVLALEKNDLYQLCDSLLQVSDFFNGFYQAMH